MDTTTAFAQQSSAAGTKATTLAETLLEDLDDLSDNDDNYDAQEETENGDESKGAASEEVNRTGWQLQKWHPSSVIKKRRRLLENPSLQVHLKAIQTLESKQQVQQNDYSLDDSPSWILQSNQHLAAVVTEMQECHADLRLAYRPKFPELEELIPNLLQYKYVVATIGNDADVAHAVMERLQPTNVATASNNNNNNNIIHAHSQQQQQPQVVLTNNQIITLSVAASTTLGRLLTDEEYRRVQVELDYMDQLLQVQQVLTTFVQERMQLLAPTMCALLGSTTLVAQMIGLAGGSLADLAKIPSCNLQVLGRKQQVVLVQQQQQQQALQQQQQVSITMTSASTSHMGCLAQCDLVMTMCPKPLQKKALKVVAAKLALAIRMDHVAQSTTMPTPAARAAATNQGMDFRQDIIHKIQAWQEPHKAMVSKALPKPDLTIKKRRGGKRMRRLKERYEETALMKQANTRSFSGPTGEYGDDAMGLTMGLLDTSIGGDAAAAGESAAAGSLRKHAVEKRKFRQANTKASRKRAAQLSAVSAQASASSSSGLASSMVFTPVQGMELIDPEANKERVREANRKWFVENSGFQSALPPRK